MSDDLIRRSDAIKSLNDYLGDCYRVSRRKYEKTMLDAISMDFEAVITNIPAVEPKQEWILVSKRLPERQGYYICTCKDGPIYRRTTTIKWSNGWQLSGRRSFWTVVAWMPLPEPWERADHKTENSSEKPNNCETCRHKHDGTIGYCKTCGESNYEPKDEPQMGLCRDCEDYAGNGMFCAKDYMVYDFSRSVCKAEPQERSE